MCSSDLGQIFRKEGYGGSGIDGLTKAAGVTNGAFYGHFRSKSEAFRETVLTGLEELRLAIAQLKADKGGGWLSAFASYYLGTKRVCDLGQSCALPSLSPEVMRADDETRQAYQQELQRLIAEVYRYANMDYLFLRSLRLVFLVWLVVSYDIACQWAKNLRDRMGLYPHELQTALEGFLSLVFLVPKFHLPAHIASCQIEYSFNLTRWVGRTDGEAPERGWSRFNSVATQTKEMGPGSRRDTLDDHFGDWNWKKTVGLGKCQ